MKIHHRARFSIFAFFGLFGLKRAEIDRNEENWQNPNRLMKFSEIWYVYRCFPTTKNATKKLFLDFGLCRFLTKKQPKLTKNEVNWQNPNRLMKFSEIWYVNASQQKNAANRFF